MTKLDALDRKLLIELDKNARLPFSQLAKKVRSSKAVVSYRMKNLEQSGVIKKYLSVIDPVKLGYLTFKIFMQLQNINEESEKKIINFLFKHKNMLRVVKLEGNYDLSAVILIKSTFELNEVLREIKNKIKDKLRSYEVELILFSHMSGLKFLGDKTKYSRMEFQGGHKKEIKIDKFDRKILKEISQNARKSLVEIAVKLKKSADIIKYRLKRLEKQEIITRYKHYIDLSKLGFYHFVILLKLQNASSEDEERIIDYTMEQTPYLYTTKTIGSWDFEINLFSSSLEDFNQTLSKFKNKFQKIIKSYSTIFVSKEIKLNYYPF